MRQLLVCALVLLPLACGSGDSNFGDDSGVDASLPTDSGPLFGDTGASDSSGPCVNLQCQVVSCGGNVTTTVSGTVVTATPAQYGSPDPIYNAIVYVPNAPLTPFPLGVACD